MFIHLIYSCENFSTPILLDEKSEFKKINAILTNHTVLSDFSEVISFETMFYI